MAMKSNSLSILQIWRSSSSSLELLEKMRMLKAAMEMVSPNKYEQEMKKKRNRTNRKRFFTDFIYSKFTIAVINLSKPQSTSISRK